MSIRETADGVVLLRCFAGCDARSIVEAVGLELGDLFPDKVARRAPKRRILSRDSWIVKLAAEDMRRGKALSDADLAVLAKAKKRIRDE